MIVDILNKMAEIVASTMTSFQSDFEKYDKEYITREGVKAFPFLWMVAPSHTYLLRFADFKKDFFENEALRYSIVQKSSWYHAYLWPNRGKVSEKIYYVTVDGLREVSVEQAREIMRDIITPVIAAWEQEHEKIPTKSKVRVEFQDISLAQLKRLIQDCRYHNNDTLWECLKRFHNYQQCAKDHKIIVKWNDCYQRFSFCEFINGKAQLSGGIVFHGWPESGYQVNNSVQLDPLYGWASHT